LNNETGFPSERTLDTILFFLERSSYLYILLIILVYV